MSGDLFLKISKFLIYAEICTHWNLYSCTEFLHRSLTKTTRIFQENMVCLLDSNETLLQPENFTNFSSESPAILLISRLVAENSSTRPDTAFVMKFIVRRIPTHICADHKVIDKIK